MAKQLIDRGTVDDPKTGDSLYEGAGKINDNMTELYNRPISEVEEAPEDGKQYARKDAGWDEVSAGDTSSYYSAKVTASNSNTMNLFQNAIIVVNSTSGDVVFNGPNGTFDFSSTGIFKIDINLYLEGTSVAHILDLKQNGTTVLLSDTFVNSAVDPVERSLSIILSVTSSDVFSVHTAAAITVRRGTTFNAYKV
jgi:hypothetical protein